MSYVFYLHEWSRNIPRWRSAPVIQWDLGMFDSEAASIMFYFISLTV